MKRIKTAFSAVLLLATPFVDALSPSEIPEDTPLSALIDSAKASLAQGNSHDALAYYDVAVSRDPQNYLTIFQRGATYLSLGRDVLAGEDFDKVLSIKPDFESALLQRARLKARSAEWEAAVEDFRRARKEDEPEFQELQEAQTAAKAAEEADAASDWEGCVTHAGTAIRVASKVPSLRQLRARCRFERGEMQEGISDLQHVLQLSSGSIDPHLLISATLFYSLGDTEKGLAQIKKCLHSDPDSKPCSKLYRRERADNKEYERLAKLQEKRQFNSAVKILAGTEEDQGLIKDVKEAVKTYKEDGTIPQKAPEDFSSRLVEMTCELYGEVCAYNLHITSV
jgi:DnaJ homolog subfamily C member 3